MNEHLIPRIRNQRGPVATCGVPRCGRQVHWSVMQDVWLHTYTVDQEAARQAESVEAIVSMMRGLAGQLHGHAFYTDRRGLVRDAIETPDMVEAILRASAKR